MIFNRMDGLNNPIVKLVNLFNNNDTFFTLCLGVGSVVVMSLSFGVMILGMIWF